VVTGNPPVRGRVHGIDVARVEAAIRQAEARTSGEIRVAVSRFYFWGDVRRAAQGAFARLHMERTRLRNGVLIFVAPRRRRFAILGDAGIHERAGDGSWKAIVDLVGREFRAGELTSGLEKGIAAIGECLARHFPADSKGDANELSDAVVVEGGGSIP
jgi:uncharacterized membrane protein